MIFEETKLPGAYILGLQQIRDDRGFFARSWCRDEFIAQGLNPRLVQCNISFNRHRGTLRGMHFQIAPHEEAKLVRCTRGGIFDVIVDIRPTSSTFRQWVGVELTADNHKALYIPEGLAHGFQTLTEDAEVFYQMSEFYHPESSRGVRWNDPAFGIAWPLETRIMAAKDEAYSDFTS